MARFWNEGGFLIDWVSGIEEIPPAMAVGATSSSISSMLIYLNLISKRRVSKNLILLEIMSGELKFFYNIFLMMEE